MKNNSNWLEIAEKFRKKFPFAIIDWRPGFENDGDGKATDKMKEILAFFKPYFQEQMHEKAVEELEKGGLVDTLNYNLGYRDALASVLAENKNKIKLPDLAVYYAKCFLEEHFSHEWHTK